MRSNPATYRGVAAGKAAAQASAWRDLARYLKKFKTVPVVAKRVTDKVKPEIVYALKIGNAISQDAFTVFDDAVGVAKALADRYQIPISVVDKKTKARAHLSEPKKYARNPADVAGPTRAGDWYFSDGYTTREFRSKRAAFAAAQKLADETGKRVRVHQYEFSGGARRGFTGIPRSSRGTKERTMRRNPTSKKAGSYYDTDNDVNYILRDVVTDRHTLGPYTTLHAAKVAKGKSANKSRLYIEARVYNRDGGWPVAAYRVSK